MTERIDREVEQLLDEAFSALREGDLIEARERAQTAVILDPGNHDALVLLERLEAVDGKEASTLFDAEEPEPETVRVGDVESWDEAQRLAAEGVRQELAKELTKSVSEPPTPASGRLALWEQGVPSFLAAPREVVLGVRGEPGGWAMLLSPEMSRPNLDDDVTICVDWAVPTGFHGAPHPSRVEAALSALGFEHHVEARSFRQELQLRPGDHRGSEDVADNVLGVMESVYGIPRYNVEVFVDWEPVFGTSKSGSEGAKGS